MNTTTLKNRIAFVYTKKNQLNAHYSSAIEFLEKLAKGERVHPKHWAGSYSHMNLVDKSIRLEEILKAAKIAFINGNDAEHSGVEGDFYELTAAGRKQLKDVDFSKLDKR